MGVEHIKILRFPRVEFPKINVTGYYRSYIEALREGRRESGLPLDDLPYIVWRNNNIKDQVPIPNKTTLLKLI